VEFYLQTPYKASALNLKSGKMVGIRANHPVRLQAFDLLQELKDENISRQAIVDQINHDFGIPATTIYFWYTGQFVPYGRKGKIVWRPELFYVLGALLGDGCIYRWKPTNNYVILVGDKKFTTKYSDMLEPCISKRDKPYIIRSKNVWFVKSNNFELFSFFKKAREDSTYLENLFVRNDRRSRLLFIEGFFDAEGCVKIIKEKVRKTPKICLDITNTNYGFLNLIKKLLKDELGIEALFSIQEPREENRKIAYHLRIYKKEFVRKFFENIGTTKLYDEKAIHLQNWLALSA